MLKNEMNNLMKSMKNQKKKEKTGKKLLIRKES